MNITGWQWGLVFWLGLWGEVALSQDADMPVTPNIEGVISSAAPATKSGLLAGAAAATTVATIFAGINPTVAAVVIGGGLGAVSRYAVSQGVNRWVEGSFYGTMAVNITGSFAFGTVSGWVARSGSWIAGTAWLDLMTTGFLGGFTTFSTFANDTVQIARRGGVLFSSLYIGFSVAVSVMGVLAGEFIGTALLP
ncbi:fluoride exporter [Gammaproteobacteria bacterium]